MTILLPFFAIFFAIIPAMLHTAEMMSPSVYFMILSALGLALIIITVFMMGNAAPLFALPILCGVLICTVVGIASLCCYKFVDTKKASQLEQVKVPVKTKVITKNSLKQKRS